MHIIQTCSFDNTEIGVDWGLHPTGARDMLPGSDIITPSHPAGKHSCTTVPPLPQPRGKRHSVRGQESLSWEDSSAFSDHGSVDNKGRIV